MQNESDHFVNENGKRTLVEVSAGPPNVQKRIKFNVGGHRYEISRDVLMGRPETMLARSASDLWHKDPEQEIFLNGDGERFRYVLDYLRDGEVHLPFTIPKPALVKDLEYFGFENIDINQIKVHDGNAELAAAILKKEEQLNADIVSMDLAILKMRRKRLYRLIAHECFRFYCRHGTLIDMKVVMDLTKEDRLVGMARTSFNGTEFNEALARYDFKLMGGKMSFIQSEKCLNLSLVRIERTELGRSTDVE